MNVIKKLGSIEEDEASVLQQKMYFDIWNNDSYLQFMYERFLLMKELLADTGCIYVHLDWHVGHYIKVLMDEVFGESNFSNEIIWYYSGGGASKKEFANKHDTILCYKKAEQPIFNVDEVRMDYKWVDGQKRADGTKRNLEKGKLPDDVLGLDIIKLNKIMPWAKENTGFYTQKNEALVSTLIRASSKKDYLVLDCFIGSGTTARVCQHLGRRWIGCDINKGAIHLTSREVQKIINEQIKKKKEETKYPSFAIYKVNNYDLKILQTEAIELAVQHIGVQRTRTDSYFDGHLGKGLVKIIDFNHPLSLLDLQLLKDELKKRPDEDRNIVIVCLGKELAVDPWLEDWNKKRPVNKIKVIELKTDKNKASEAKIQIKRKKNKASIQIKDFISPTIIERLDIDAKLFKVKIPDFRSMIDTVLIDNN